jgi:lipoprotein-anchoring transpeptidase ErfK/SrfK
MTQQSRPSRRLPSRAARTLAFASVLLAAPFVATGSASAQSYGQNTYGQGTYDNGQALGYASTLPGGFPTDEVMTDPTTEDGALPERLRRTTVAINTNEAPGTVIIDTGNTALYYVLGGGRAIRYGVGVGREGFTWSGVQTISRKAEWPDWHPPVEMIKRQPYLPRFMAGGPGNPLGARAMYLGSSEYRIHGTNAPSTIGKFVSSGCVRLTNEDVADLFNRVNVGTKIVVLPKNAAHIAARELGPALPSGRQAMNIPGSASLY